MRVGIYTRISSDDSSGIKGLGVLRQEQACREFATGRRWEVVEVYVDNNVSASCRAEVARPEYDRMLIDLAAGRIERILVLGQDRLLRRPEQLETLFRIHRNLDIPTIECVTGPQIDMLSATGRTHARIKAVFDVAYSEYVSEKVTQKKRELADRGLPHGGGRRPFGYSTDGMYLVEREADLTCEAIDRVLNRQETLWQISADWNARNITTTTGGIWQPASLREVLRRPRNAGLREYRGEIRGPAVWPAIISEQTRVAVLAALDAHAKRKGEVFRRRLLTGILVCGRCGCRLSSGGAAAKRDYRCNAAPGRCGCGHTCIRAVPIESYVIQAAIDHLEQLNNRPHLDDNGIVGALAADRHALHELARRRFVERDLSDGEYQAARDPLVERIHDTELQTKIADPFNADSLRRNWQQLSLAEMHSLIRRAITTINVGPDRKVRHRMDFERLDIHWRQPS